jgi:hypothetical protein
MKSYRKSKGLVRNREEDRLQAVCPNAPERSQK